MANWIVLVTEPSIKLVNVLRKLQCAPVVSAYFLMIALSGAWQKNVPIVCARKILVLYNVVCILLSFITAYFCLYGCYDAGTPFLLVKNWYIQAGCFMYMVSKYTELLDTIFMILRHRNRQISFLQVYHHSTVLLLADYVNSNAAYPPMAFIMGINSIVHIFLYGYYAYTAVSPIRSVECKKALTQLQILQFLITIVHTAIGYLHYGFCIFAALYMTSMLLLFSNFYFWAYVYKKKSKSE